MMRIVCDGCNKKYKIDEKKMKTETARVVCKSCGNRILVKKPAPAPDEALETGGAPPAPDVSRMEEPAAPAPPPPEDSPMEAPAETAPPPPDDSPLEAPVETALPPPDDSFMEEPAAAPPTPDDSFMEAPTVES
ncbi:MAG: hypothetical protein GY859_17090, partial [Desulfobacterales bacterium]|nr:hypothetical protein [Desulfobacterales bacterium]